MKDDFSYDDIIDLPHHRSDRYPHMSLRDRAAQFAPFAALTGFDGVIAETGRETEARHELSESETEALSRKLTHIDGLTQSGGRPKTTVICFVPDARKAGGAYVGYTGHVKKVDSVLRLLIFTDGKGIPIDDIREIRSEKEK